MIRTIRQDEFELFNDDPVRPHINHEWRTRSGKEVYVLENDNTGKIDAVICVAFMDEVPADEHDMMWPGIGVAVFYTVWSYNRGAGREIVNGVANILKRTRPYIKRFVTLSPKTEMARNFHTKNGAIEYRVNENTVNFEYEL